MQRNSGQISTVFYGVLTPKANLSKAEQWAIKELKGDKSRKILTADKGVTIVVMERREYIDKSNNLLVQPAYKPIPTDPTNRIKAKLFTLLRNIKQQTCLYDSTYKYMYPTGCSTPKFYGLP